MEQLGGSSAQSNGVQESAEMNSMELRSLIMPQDGRCKYISPGGKPCQSQIKDKRSQARHWLNCHVMKEVRAIRSKKLDMSQASVVNTTARYEVAMEYATFCPLCPETESKWFFVRPDSLIRHLRQCGYTNDMATEWTQEHMVLYKDDQGQCFAAIKRIYEAS